MHWYGLKLALLIVLLLRLLSCSLNPEE